MHDLVLNSVNNSDCLIEGTVKDRVSHYTLRLMCCQDEEMSKLLVTAETLLFNFRFSCMTYKELVKLFNSLDPFLSQNSANAMQCASWTLNPVLATFLSIKSAFKKWKTLIHKYLSGDEECFQIHFKWVPDLVARRKVVLENGNANIPVWRLREVVTSLFRKILQSELKYSKRHTYNLDERIFMIFRQIKVLFYQTVKTTINNRLAWKMTHMDVDEMTHMFPPCMSTLHRKLRKHHRLNHHARIQYTLFLKELGLPVHEALMFWRKEYSLSPSNNAVCCHDWSHDEHRYTYNIRHLYGLEGSRTNYRGHSCTALQAFVPHHTASGGCPFTQFDRAHLMDFLSVEKVLPVEILEQTIAGHPGQACWAYQQAKLKVSCDHGMKQQLSPHGGQRDGLFIGDQNIDRTRQLKMKQGKQSPVAGTCNDEGEEHMLTAFTGEMCHVGPVDENPSIVPYCRQCSVPKLIHGTSVTQSVNNLNDSRIKKLVESCRNTSAGYKVTDPELCGSCQSNNDVKVEVSLNTDVRSAVNAVNKQSDDNGVVPVSDTGKDAACDRTMFVKPVDYCSSYKKLLANLKAAKCETSN